MISHLKYILFIAVVLSVSFGAGSARAQVQAVQNNEVGQGDLIPPMGLTGSFRNTDISAGDSFTHPALYLTPDRSEIVNLTQDIGSIVVGNPNHLNVLADNANRLIFVPRRQGATHVTILAQDGSVIMQRNVIISAERKNYIRIRRGCTSDGCQPTSVYYCPDNCHEIYIDESSAAASGSKEANEEALENAMETVMEDNMREAMQNAAENVIPGGQGDVE